MTATILRLEDCCRVPEFRFEVAMCSVTMPPAAADSQVEPGENGGFQRICVANCLLSFTTIPMVAAA